MGQYFPVKFNVSNSSIIIAAAAYLVHEHVTFKFSSHVSSVTYVYV